MRIAKLLSVAFIVVVAGGLIGCNKPAEPERDPGSGPTTQPAAKVATVNDKCPMMGGKVIKAGVSPALVRDFNGQKVGFCCAGCLAPWDKLTEIEKAEKLAVVMVPTP